jgi:hypothetical protein
VIKALYLLFIRTIAALNCKTRFIIPVRRGKFQKLSLSKGLILNRILTGIILSLFIITGYIMYLVHERQSELQKLTRYTDTWSVSQVVSEYMRLESCLGAYALGVESADHDQVRLRLDIMLSQMELLQQGELGILFIKMPGARPPSIA